VQTNSLNTYFYPSYDCKKTISECPTCSQKVNHHKSTAILSRSDYVVWKKLIGLFQVLYCLSHLEHWVLRQSKILLQIHTRRCTIFLHHAYDFNPYMQYLKMLSFLCRDPQNIWMISYMQIIGYICHSWNPDCVTVNIIHHQILVENLVKFLVKLFT